MLKYILSALLSLSLAAPALAQSQGANGAIEGIVSDSSGGVLPGVTVTVSNLDTGTTRSVPVSRLVTVTVTPGSTPPELSETVPSIAPLAPCDCANAGAASDADSRAERMYLSMSASIQRIGESEPWRVDD